MIALIHHLLGTKVRFRTAQGRSVKGRLVGVSVVAGDPIELFIETKRRRVRVPVRDII